MLFLGMTHWNFVGELKKKRKEVELKIQNLLLPDSQAGKIGVKIQFPDSRVSRLVLVMMIFDNQTVVFMILAEKGVHQFSNSFSPLYSGQTPVFTLYSSFLS